MKHVYIFDKNSVAAIYGIGTYIKQLIESFSGLSDYYVNYINIRSDEMEFSVIETVGCRYFTIPNDYVKSEKNNERYCIRVFFILLPYLKEHRYDISIFHFNYIDILPIIPLIKEYIPLVKTVMTIHSQNWAFACKGNLNYFRSIISSDDSLLSNEEISIKKCFESEKPLYQSVDKIISLSDYTQSILIEDYQINPSSVVHVCNGLKDVYVELSERKKNEIRKRLGILYNEKVVLYVGRLESLKGVDSLISSFKLVLEHYPKAHLYLLGDGNLVDYMSTISGYWNKITFTGYLDREYLLQFYQVADIGILPSFSEQCSCVAIEMLMFNIPLLVTTAGGLDEMLEGVNKIEIQESNKDVIISIHKMAELVVDLLIAPKSDLYRGIYLKKYEETIFIKNMKLFYNSIC